MHQRTGFWSLFLRHPGRDALQRPRNTFLVSALAAIALALTGCASAPPEFASDISEDETYYTQVGMWADKGVEIIATNYQRGTFIPVNSEAHIQEITGETITFRVPELGEQTFQLANVPKYTQADMRELFDRTFAKKPADLDDYSEEVVDNIREGRVEPGMSKDAVVLARGYPPAHETPDLDLNRWRYWVNRFATNVVVFSDGEVDEIIK